MLEDNLKVLIEGLKDSVLLNVDDVDAFDVDIVFLMIIPIIH